MRCIVRVDGQHRVALMHLAGDLVDPDVPEPGQTPGVAIGVLELLPDVLFRFPVRFLESRRRNDATLPALPRILVAGLRLELFAARVVRWEFELRILHEPWDQAPLPTTNSRS